MFFLHLSLCQHLGGGEHICIKGAECHLNLTLSVAVAFWNQPGNWTFVQAPGAANREIRDISGCFQEVDVDGCQWYTLEKSTWNLKMGAPWETRFLFGNP